MMVKREHSGPSFTLSFRPNTALVSSVRRFVADVYECWLTPELTSEVALASHELLENAVLHSSNGETEVHIEISLLGDGQAVAIRTRNAASPENLDVLRAAFAELEAALDPDAYYQAMMRRSVERTQGSGLGLARIRAETGLAMTLDITDDHVSISARIETRARGSQA
jgi:anti-sigma regulatory factor (Ser/Thr protein kinase)